MIYTEIFGSLTMLLKLTNLTHVNNGCRFCWYHTWNHCGYYRTDYLRSEASEGLPSRSPNFLFGKNKELVRNTHVNIIVPLVIRVVTHITHNLFGLPNRFAPKITSNNP